MYFYIIFRQIHLKFKCICLKNLVCHKLSTFDKPVFYFKQEILKITITHISFSLSQFWSIFTKIFFCTFAFSGSGSCKSKSHRMSGRKSKWVEVLKIFTTGHPQSISNCHNAKCQDGRKSKWIRGGNYKKRKDFVKLFPIFSLKSWNYNFYHCYFIVLITVIHINSLILSQ